MAKVSTIALLLSLLVFNPVVATAQARDDGLVLKRAEATWPSFLNRFKRALMTHNRPALYAMTSRKLEENCLVENGRDIRKEFFARNDQLEHYLDIITPGRNKYHRATFGSAQREDSTGDVSRIAEMACWSLTFTFRSETGWLLTYYGQQCEGC